MHISCIQDIFRYTGKLIYTDTACHRIQTVATLVFN